MSFLRTVRLRVPAAVAKPGPAIGQALGPLGVNMMEFCKKFNEESKHIVNETPCPVVLSAFSDRTFTFYINSPTTSYLVKKAAGMEAGVSRPGSMVGGYISPQAIYEIALIKSKDVANQGQTLEALCKSIVGTCHSQGIEVRDDVEEAESAA